MDVAGFEPGFSLKLAVLSSGLSILKAEMMQNDRI